MFDAKIVSACIASRKAYTRIVAHVDTTEFTPTGRFWWGLVEQWYTADPRADSIDGVLLRDRGERAAGRNVGMALDWYNSLPAAPSPDNVAWEVLELKRVVKWRELAAASETEWDRDRIVQLAEEHLALMQATDLEQSKLDWGSSLEDLSRAIGTENRIRLWPEQLNTRTGGALKGHHIVVFGRPEVGKTLFSVNMVSGWLRDGHKVLYVGNEDKIDTIKERVRWNLAGMTAPQVAQFTDEANRRALNKGWDNLKAVHVYPGSAPEIADLIEQTEPDCLVVDQLRNMRSAGGGKSGTKAQRLDDVACDVRQLLAKYNLLGLSVGQANAGEHGHAKVWLELDDFDESRTGVPGQADLMVGIGMDPALDAHNQRALSLPKNKLSGDHTGFVVNIDKTRSKIQ